MGNRSFPMRITTRYFFLRISVYSPWQFTFQPEVSLSSKNSPLHDIASPVTKGVKQLFASLKNISNHYQLQLNTIEKKKKECITPHL